MKSFIILLSLIVNYAIAGLPPTATKFGTDTNFQTTFNFDFTGFTGTRTGTTLKINEHFADKVLENTRIITGGVVSANGTNAIDISAMTASFYNTSTGLENHISCPAVTAYSIAANIAAGADASYILVDATCAVTAITTDPSPSQLRDNVYLSKVAHRSGGNITNVRNFRMYGEEAVQNIWDLTEAIGTLTLYGNEYSAASTNLQLKKSAGISYRFIVNADLDRKTPSKISDIAVNPVTFIYAQRRTGGGVLYTASQTAIVPGQYDVGNSTLASVPNNEWSVQRIYHFPRTNSTYIFYARSKYSTLALAEASISAESFDLDTQFFSGAALRAYLIVRGAAVNLADSGDAKFVTLGKFGGVGGGGGTSLVLYQTVNNQAGAYAPVASDCNGIIKISSAVDVNLTLSALPTGCAYDIFQGSTGSITVVTGGGVTPVNSLGLFKTRTQYSAIVVKHTSATEAYVTGDLK